MRTSQHFVRTLLLTALALGMNLLSYADVAHGRAAHHRSRISYSHVPPHGSHRPTGRGGRTLRVAATDNQSSDSAEVALAPKLKPIHPAVPSPTVALLQQSLLPQPENLSAPLAQAHVLAQGSAPRAPGGSRAPPIA
ncbi:hypothetical protein [Terriglobus tenax]|uniref:hypothetical protein n=1 Tax=Terriglobus tenax TaxID=1111115 RepID=UPI0021DF8B62|nr:hypothetical protein [Terriglobus tenax]